MAVLEARDFARATDPDQESLTAALTPLLGTGLQRRWLGSTVRVRLADWSGVDDAVVQAAVAAAPEQTEKSRARTLVRNMPVELKQTFAELLSMVNEERAARGVQQVSVQEFVQNVVARIGS